MYKVTLNGGNDFLVTSFELDKNVYRFIRVLNNRTFSSSSHKDTVQSIVKYKGEKLKYQSHFCHVMESEEVNDECENQAATIS